MSHLHSVYDTDKHFVIDPITRNISTESNKLVLTRYDHNSERFTFEIPRYIEGHDMFECNQIEIHADNIGKTNSECNSDVYTVDDKQLSPDDENIVIFSWLISRAFTQIVGKLSFSIDFACIAEDGVEEYSWGTNNFDKVSINNRIHNTQKVIEEHSDFVGIMQGRYDELAKRSATKEEVEQTSNQLNNTKLNKPSAKVGQMIVVKSVNNDGKAEELEAIDKPDIPSLTGYATENYVKDYAQPKGNYLTEHQDISDYAKKATTLAGYGITDGATKEEVGQLSEDIEWLYDSAREIKYTLSNNIMVGEVDRRGYIYKSDIATGTTLIIELNKGQKIRYLLSKINRCRLAVCYTTFDNVTIINKGNVPEVFTDKLLAYDDSLTNLTGEYTANNDFETLIFYIGNNMIVDYSVHCIKELSNNIRVKSSCIIDDDIQLDIINEFEPFSEDYSAQGNDPKLQNTTSEEFYNLFYNPHLGYQKQGNYKVTKRILGKDQSNTYDIFEYDFCPKDYKKTILLTSGLHAYETPASFGLAMWIRDLMSEKSATLKWIKEHIRIKVIPIANPWGFNQYPKTYGNCNGVNPNRNFNTWDNKWYDFPIYSANPTDENYNEWNVKGSEPFSEAETRIIKEWLYDNNNAEFWIDCHIGIGCNYGENWILYQSTNPNISKITKAVKELENRMKNKYGITNPTTLKEIDKDTSIKIAFSNDVVGIPQMVIEQSGNNRVFNTEINNTPIKITEYATTIHAYVVAQLLD